MKTKRKNAPYLAEQAQDGAELIILIGSKAWQAWNKGEGLEWSLLAQAIKTDPKQPPVIIGESQLEEINLLNLAENDRTSVRLCQFGKFSHSEALPAVVANLAKNTQVRQLTLCDSLGELQENGNLSDWLKRTREQAGDSVADMLASLAQDEDVKREPYIEKRTENGQQGLFYITPKFDRTTGEFISEKVQFLSDIVEVVGVGYNAEESHLILKFTPENRKKAVIVAQPLATIGEREGWQQLKAKGLRVTNNGTLKGILADYLQLSGNRQEWQVTDKTGWINGAYILPNGEIIGESSKPTIFIGGTSVKSGYCTAGTAESWREHVANYAKNNASMMLAVSVALAGPMLALLKKEPFGVHLYGGSSVGKTTTAYLASSVFGHPKDTKLSWFSTALGVANEALAHNDGFLFLDEVGQASNAKDVETSAYTLFNGVGKIQGAKEGGNRELKRWNTIAFSTGEKDIETYLKENGISIKAGQLVRLLNVPIKPAMHFNGLENGTLHANHLQQATQENFGMIGRLWVEWLAKNEEALNNEYQAQAKKWLERLPSDASGQVKRVVDKFAILETALMLSAFLTGWQAQEISESITQSFNEWVNEFGMHSREEKQIIEQVIAFLQQHRARFIEYPFDPNQRTPSNLAGFIELAQNDEYERFNVFPVVYTSEMIKGFNEKQASHILHNRGILTKTKEAPARFTVKLSSKIDKSRPRVYQIIIPEGY